MPAGRWHDFWTGRAIEGQQTADIEPPLDQIPLYVKAGTLLPLAGVSQHAGDPEGRRLSVRVYGEAPRPATLYEDDGQLPPTLGEVTLSWDGAARQGLLKRSGPSMDPGYEAVEWITV